MNQPGKLSRSGLGSLVLIAAVLAGWRRRLRVHRRLALARTSHAERRSEGADAAARRTARQRAKLMPAGICFTGALFEANGKRGGASRGQGLRARAGTPARGPFLNLGTADPNGGGCNRACAAWWGLPILGMGGRRGVADGEADQPARSSRFPRPQAFHDLLRPLHPAAGSLRCIGHGVRPRAIRPAAAFVVSAVECPDQWCALSVSSSTVLIVWPSSMPACADHARGASASLLPLKCRS